MFIMTADDPHYTSVVLCLPMIGENNSTTFTDVSPTPKTATRYNAIISTAQSKWGDGSGYFDGSGDYLEVTHSSDLNLGSGDFTQECWVRFSGYPVDNSTYYVFHLFGKMRLDSDQSGQGYFIQVQGTASSLTTLVWRGHTNDATPNELSVSYSFALNTWYHIAVVRWSNKIYFYVDGVLINSGGTAFTETIQDNTNPIRVGRYYNSVYFYDFNGYLQDLRITKGIARYKENFTPPSRLFPVRRRDQYASILYQPSFHQAARLGL